MLRKVCIVKVLQVSLSFTSPQSLLEFMSTELVMLSNHFIRDASYSFCFQSFPVSGSLPMSGVALCIRWPKYWSCSLSISPSNEYSALPLGLTGLISLQSKGLSRVFSSTTKASVLWHSAFFIVQFSRSYVTTGKTIALTMWTFVGKVMSLLFNILSRLVIVFLPRTKHLLISCLRSVSAVILEPKEVKPR